MYFKFYLLIFKLAYIYNSYEIHKQCNYLFCCSKFNKSGIILPNPGRHLF
jgi:hypothetical protein